jgi:hypothetical protein
VKAGIGNVAAGVLQHVAVTPNGLLVRRLGCMP